jgi:hypothetical protein
MTLSQSTTNGVRIARRAGAECGAAQWEFD